MESLAALMKDMKTAGEDRKGKTAQVSPPS